MMTAGFSAAVLLTFALVTTAFADSVIPPHVSEGDETDSCAMCHRAHTSGSDITATDQLGTEHNALIVGTFSAQEGDTQLCFTCHGWAGAGAVAADIEEEFGRLSYHRIAPEASDFGTSPKDCSTCHDSHGSAKTASDTPYPALLRVADEGLTSVYQGDEYCAVCHDDRPADVWDGIAIWKQTAHADVTATASGTEIVCSVCHEPHGSDSTALITAVLIPPSVLDTISVSANDRSLCFGCHPSALATYPGAEVYETSTHGSTEETVEAATEWATRLVGSEETTRLAGECQVCHSPMGTDDGSGTPIPKLANAEGNELCYRCHDGSLPLAADIASVYPTTTADVPEIITAYGATPATAQFGIAQVYSGESSVTAELPSPRQFLEGQVGPMVAGDIDGDGLAEAIVARKGSAAVSLTRSSALAGLSSQNIALLGEASYVAVGDVLSDTGNLREVISVTTTTAVGVPDVVRVYRLNGANLTMVLSAAIEVTGRISGLTAGNVMGTTHDDIVVTTNVPNQLYLMEGGVGNVVVHGPYATGPLPKGPSVGDLDNDGLGEIAVAFSGENNTPTFGVYDSSGILQASAGSTGGGARRGLRTLIHDIFWGTPPAAGHTGAEVVLTVADPDDGNLDGARVDVFTQAADGTFPTVASYPLTKYSNPAEMAAGDVDGDGHDELVVARAGTVKYIGPPNPPGISVVKTNVAGTAIAGDTFYQGAGVEAADSGPGPAWVAIAEMGDVGPSKHAAGTVPGAHVSTETVGFTRHVDCVDCHNVHEATSTPAAAPLAYGSIKGTGGLTLAGDPVSSITKEYELCLKCHTSSPDTRNIAAEISQSNMSVHAITEPSTTSQATAASFVATSGFTVGSVLYCVDCHGNAETSDPIGPHVSAQAPLLVQPYWGVASADNVDHLCFKCHERNVYYTGTADGPTVSRFYNDKKPDAMHSYLTLERGLSCAACHLSHGGSEQALLRSDVNFTPTATGGSCTNGCHTGGTQVRTYTRP